MIISYSSMIFKLCTSVCSNSHMEIYRSCCRVRFPKFIKLSKLSGSPGARCIGAFSCCFLKIISKMFDGFEEKYYLCRRNDDIELGLCAD